MLPQIIIRQTMGSMSIETTHARLTPATRTLQMNIKQPGPGLRMHATQPQIHIDQTEAFASAGLKKPMRMIGEFNKKSLQKGLQAISTITQESLQFLQIEKGNPTVQLARQAGVRDVQLTVQSMPDAAPEISVMPGAVNITFAQSALQTDWEWAVKEGEYTPHSIKISWTRPSIEISFEPGVELHFPVSSGRGAAVDAAI